jgi:hypothetical protein
MGVANTAARLNALAHQWHPLQGKGQVGWGILPLEPEPEADAALELRAKIAETRANVLSDRCGALESELRDVKAENSDLRREVERLKRKAGVR